MNKMILRTMPGRVLFVAISLLLLPAIGLARLGETEQQSQQRYGAPIDSPIDKTTPLLEGAICRTYRYQGWMIRVAYLEGKTAMIRYQKIVESGISPQIKDDEADAILTGEVGSGTWKSQIQPSSNPAEVFANAVTTTGRWLNTNGSIAQLSSGRVYMTVESPEVATHLDALKVQKEEARKARIPEF